MTTVFDIALEKRFTDSNQITAINVTANDTLLIRNSETGEVMKMPFSILQAALSSAFSGTYATLVDGKVPASQLPSYVDDVLEYTNLASFPSTGETGKIYVDLTTNKTYRWSGSAYVEISPSLALGETSATAYRGDRGKTAYDHSQTTGNPHGTTKGNVGLGNVDNTADADKPISTAQQAAFDARVRVLAVSNAPQTLTGTTNETTLFSGTIPGGSMGANGIVRITTLWSFSGANGTRRGRIKFNGASFTDYSNAATVNAWHNLTMIRNRNATNSQIGFVAGSASSLVTTTSTNVTASHDTTADIPLLITGQLGNASDSMTLESVLVEIIKG